MNVDLINPFLSATTSVFDRMFGMTLVRETPYVRKTLSAPHEVTGIIGLSGKATGTVAFSLSTEMALRITEKLLGERPPELDAQVVDAVGEVTNMIAGAAKSQLEQLELNLGLPTVLVGHAASVGFPSRAVPISIPFTSPLGSMVVEVGIVL
jgi:chemotaxis protein CheX